MNKAEGALRGRGRKTETWQEGSEPETRGEEKGEPSGKPASRYKEVRNEQEKDLRQ